MKKLSIIIPVYNVERYLRECVDSIISQIDNKTEIIMVDDGSTDSSPAICDEYEKHEEIEIKVIHQINKGLSGARNAGLQIAQGRYIAFVDSDDRLTFGAIPQLLKLIDNEPVDLFIMKGIKFYPNGTQEPLDEDINKGDIYGMSHEAVISYISHMVKYPGSACTKIYSMEFLTNNDIKFPDDRRHSEDLGFVLDCLLKANTYNVVDAQYYEYRQNREGSIASSLKAKSFWDLTTFVQESVKKLTVNGKAINKISEECLSFVAYEFSVMLWHYIVLDSDEKKRARSFICSWKWVLEYSNRRKFRLLGMLLRITGVDVTVWLLNIYMSHR